MKIKERLDKWIFERSVKIAKRRFEKLRRSSVYNSLPRMTRRGYVKKILWAAGFTGIRLRDKSN